MSTRIFVEHFPCDDWNLCCCGVQMGKGGDICKHGGCLSMLEWCGAICQKYQGPGLCHICGATKKEHRRPFKWVITMIVGKILRKLKLKTNR